MGILDPAETKQYNHFVYRNLYHRTNTRHNSFIFPFYLSWWSALTEINLLSQSTITNILLPAWLMQFQNIGDKRTDSTNWTPWRLPFCRQIDECGIKQSSSHQQMKFFAFCERIPYSYIATAIYCSKLYSLTDFPSSKTKYPSKGNYRLKIARLVNEELAEHLFGKIINEERDFLNIDLFLPLPEPLDTTS